MFATSSAYCVVPGPEGLMSIYIDPHLGPISSLDVLKYCKKHDIYPSGSAIIKAIRLIHYGDKYLNFLSQIRTAIKIFPDSVRSYELLDEDENVDADTIMLAESKIEILSTFIADFKSAEAYYNAVLVDRQNWSHSHIDFAVFHHFDENKHIKGYLIEDAFIEVVNFYIEQHEGAHHD